MRDLQSGSFDEGGSTITQQLAKKYVLVLGQNANP